MRATLLVVVTLLTGCGTNRIVLRYAGAEIEIGGYNASYGTRGNPVRVPNAGSCIHSEEIRRTGEHS